MFSLLIRQPAKGNAVINGNLANGVNGVLDMRFVGFLFGHGNFPSLDHKCGAKALFAFAPYLPYQQRQPELSKTARGGLPALLARLALLITVAYFALVLVFPCFLCGVAVFCETAVNKNALYFCITGNNCRKGQAP